MGRGTPASTHLQSTWGHRDSHMETAPVPLPWQGALRPDARMCAHATATHTHCTRTHSHPPHSHRLTSIAEEGHTLTGGVRRLWQDGMCVHRHVHSVCIPKASTLSKDLRTQTEKAPSLVPGLASRLAFPPKCCSIESLVWALGESPDTHTAQSWAFKTLIQLQAGRRKSPKRCLSVLGRGRPTSQDPSIPKSWTQGHRGVAHWPGRWNVQQALHIQTWL